MQAKIKGKRSCTEYCTALSYIYLTFIFILFIYFMYVSLYDHNIVFS